MKKKLTLILGVATLTCVLATSAFANSRGMLFSSKTQVRGGANCSGLGYGFMMDENGNFLSQEDFEANLDKAIKDGTILENDRDYYLEMFKYCNENGGGTRRGGCCGGSFGRSSR